MGYRGNGNRLPTAQKIMLAGLLFAVGLANIDQPYPDLAPLQHIPTVIFVLAAPRLLARWPLSTASVASLWLFLLLHTLGGRYIYSYVPYDVWSKALTGQGITELFGGTRNAYDRLVHFAFGLLWTLPVAEAMRRKNGLSGALAGFMGFAFVGMTSAIYEIFEWALTLVAAGDTADYYNGQQGDMWDSQKDMALAQFGSVIALIFAKVRSK